MEIENKTTKVNNIQNKNKNKTTKTKQSKAKQQQQKKKNEKKKKNTLGLHFLIFVSFDLSF